MTADDDNGKKPDKKRSNRSARGRFTPGNRANPAGRPKGSRNKTTLMVEALLAGEADLLTRVLIKRAKAGDGTALSLVFARLCPPRKERAVLLGPLPLENL